MLDMLTASITVLTRLLKEIPTVDGKPFKVDSRVLGDSPNRAKGLIQMDDMEIVITVRKRK